MKGQGEPPAEVIRQDVARALAEDIGTGDVTGTLLSPRLVSADVMTRQIAILCGQAWATETFRQSDAKISVQWHYQDGDRLAPGQTICTASGPAPALLSAERTALNFMQLLSGVATVTAVYVHAVAHTACRVLDTRKTIPGLRPAQKYAVVCGGGHNHRLGLFDAFLIKENHIIACGSMAAAIDAAKRRRQDLLIEVEVETLAQLEEAIAAGARRILLDNFQRDQLIAAVQIARGRQVALEASGGIDLDNIVSIAETGVDFISVGALTKNVQAIDMSMRLQA